MNAAPGAETAAMPPSVYAVATARTCTDSQFSTIQAPHIEVTDSLSAGTLAVTIRLVSNVPTSLAAGAWHAFISVDGRPTIISLNPDETVLVAYRELSAGMHSIRYGVYAGDQLLQSRCFSRNVPRNDPRKSLM